MFVSISLVILEGFEQNTKHTKKKQNKKVKKCLGFWLQSNTTQTHRVIV